MGMGIGRRTEGPLLLLMALFSTCFCQNVPVVNMSVASIKEDLLEGEFAFKILAYDVDNDPLTYKIEKDFGHFSVNKDTGDVYILKPLDYEEQDFFQILVSVSDGVYAPTEKTVHVVVIDANDNAPRFLNTPYNVDVREDTPVLSTVLTVLATDLDTGTGGIVSYRIDQFIPPDGANIFSISSSGGQIQLREGLNFTHKSSFYQLFIAASDGGGSFHGNPNYVQSTITTAFITVIDTPDIDPQFLNLPNLAKVKEHSPVDGTAVFKVQARDPDTGINDVIRFSIEDSSAPGLFQIDAESGTVTVLSDIDREALLDSSSVVDLTVKATESKQNVHGVYASSTALLQIQIEDVNDNPPVFYRCEGEAGECVKESSFTGQVDEHSSVGLSVTGLNMRVKDKDAGENSRFQLRLEGTHKDAFSVSPTDDMSDRLVLILIRDPEAVDYEKNRIMYVQVVATDAKMAEFVATASVTITVNDVNDNFPVFPEEAYKLSVKEHCADGTIITTITATDKDELDAGHLTYRLLPESMLPFFDVFLNNGTVFVKDGASLDRERRSSFSPTLQARDLARNPGSTLLEITILDINDQAPQFLRDYEAFIRENNVFRLEVEARDDDEPSTPNSKIQYAIMPTKYSTNFTVDKDSGQISSKVILDREAIDPELQGVIVLNVTATDMGVPPLSSWVKVTITVDDENDNTPKYQETVYTFDVKESERGIFVGFIFARDGDQTEINNRTSFRITSGSADSFLCISEPLGDGYRGRVMVDPEVELDYESEQKSYTLKVEASDLGGNSALCTVKVVVIDVNDTPPDFPTGVTMSVPENSPPRMQIGQIKGSDVDGNHSLVYHALSMQCHCNGTWGPCEEEWFKLELTGKVITGDGPAIDYETCDVVRMTARVEDLYTEVNRNSTEGVITINIDDVNDNPPKFISLQDFFVIISENIDEEKIVARVYAEDRDTGENKKITFQVESVLFASNNPEESTKPESTNLFKAETEQPDDKGNYRGVIKATTTLDEKKQGKYLVTVMAMNGELSTNQTLELITVDQSYKVSLKFESTLGEVNENMPYIKGALTGATKARVEVVKVLAESTDSALRTERAEKKVVTRVEAYFVFLNGTALDSDAVSRILNSDEVYKEYGVQLQQYGLTGILANTETPKESNVELYIMVGLVAGLAIVLVSMSTALVCIRKKYQTKLKAAKAMNTAAMEMTDDQRDGPVVPGTNKYTRDGANPVLNLNIDSATDLGFDEEASSAERESISSLDYEVDMPTTNQDMRAIGVINEEDENDIEPLDAALAQRGRKKGPNSPSLTFTNPSVDTTDL